MDYRESCRCGGKMEAVDVNAMEAGKLVNTWRKYHVCVEPHAERETYIEREANEIASDMLDQPIWEEAK